MTATIGSRAFTDLDKRRFVRLVAKGKGRPEAAEKVGFAWSTIRKHLKEDPTFAEAVADAESELNEVVEGVLLELVLDKNLGAIQYWLNNRDPARWRDAKTVKTELTGAGGGPIMLVQANVIALREVLNDPTTREAAIGMVRSIDIAPRATLAPGQDGNTAALPSRVIREYGPTNAGPDASPLPE